MTSTAAVRAVLRHALMAALRALPAGTPAQFVMVEGTLEADPQLGLDPVTAEALTHAVASLTQDNLRQWIPAASVTHDGSVILFEQGGYLAFTCEGTTPYRGVLRPL